MEKLEIFIRVSCQFFVVNEKTEKQSDDSPKRGESREEHFS